MFEIDVDIGRLVSLGRYETLEQKLGEPGIDFGDAKAVADDGIGGRAATLAQDSLRAREHDDVMDGEKVACIILLRDDAQLVTNTVGQAFRKTLRIALSRTFPGQSFQFGLGISPGRGGLFGIVVAQLTEREFEGFGEP